jgi:hypothetical protein
MLSEFDDTSEFSFTRYPENMQTFNTELLFKLEYHMREKKDEDFLPEIEIDPRLELLNNLIRIKAKRLGLYHEIGFQIAEYYENRTMKEGSNYIPLIDELKKKILANEGSVDWMEKRLNDLRYDGGYGYQDVKIQVDRFITELRLIGASFS